MEQIIIESVTSQLHLRDGSAISAEREREIIRMALAAVREEMAHEKRLRDERSLDNGYLDRLGSEGR